MASYIYDNTLEKSDVRRVFIKYFDRYYGPKEFYGEQSRDLQWPAAFLCDYLRYKHPI